MSDLNRNAPKSDEASHPPAAMRSVAPATCRAAPDGPSGSCPMSGGWSEYVLACVGVVAAHLLPARPRITGLTRHPLLLAIGLWAAGHLVPNGDLAHVLLFGRFLAMSIAGMLVLDRRRRRQRGRRTSPPSPATPRWHLPPPGSPVAPDPAPTSCRQDAWRSPFWPISCCWPPIRPSSASRRSRAIEPMDATWPADYAAGSAPAISPVRCGRATPWASRA